MHTARIVLIMAILYLAFGFVLMLETYGPELRTFECGNRVAPNGSVWVQLPTFENPDPERCDRRGLKLSYIASIPLRVFTMPLLVGAAHTYRFADQMIRAFTQYDAAYVAGRVMMLLQRSREAHVIGVTDGTPETVIASGRDLSLPDTLPSGWYAHRRGDTSFFITKQKILPHIGATETYAYGDQAGVDLATTTLAPAEWVAEHGGIDLDDAGLIISKVWTKVHEHTLLQVEHRTGASDQLTDFLFVGNRVYTITLYPNKGAALGVFNALVERYSGDPAHRAIPDAVLAENCKKEVPPGADDTAVDLQARMITFYWWDSASGGTVSLIVPFEPEIGFAGCSESIKARLRDIQEIKRSGAFPR